MRYKSNNYKQYVYVSIRFRTRKKSITLFKNFLINKSIKSLY